jgi:hypothetical protein
MLLDQLLERLGNRAASGVVTHEVLREPIKALDGRGTILARVLFSMLHKQLGRNTIAVIDLLVANGVFAQGMIQKCPLCNHQPWYPLTALSDRLLCEYCRGIFDAKLAGPGDAKAKLNAAFRILPPLDRPDNREGLLAVLALANFARGSFSERVTIGAGLKLTGYGIDREYDLVMLARGLVGSAVLRVLFCESSAHGPFNNNDFERCKKMLQHFPTAYFAFATLRETIAEEELERARVFANMNGPAGSPQHHVIVLTGADLIPRGDKYMTGNPGSDLRNFVEDRALARVKTAADM